MADGASPAQAGLRFGAVAIGRNEGDRLVRCLKSLIQAYTVIYVDFGSSDGSVEVARGLGAEVVELEKNIPFTAALAEGTPVFVGSRGPPPTLSLCSSLMATANWTFSGRR